MAKLSKKNVPTKTKVDIRKGVIEFFTSIDIKSELPGIITPIFFIWFFLLRMYDPLAEGFNAFTSFNRNFGAASMHDIDAQMRANSMKLYNLAYSALCFLVSYLVVRFFTRVKTIERDSETYSITQSLINSIAVCGVASVAIIAVEVFNNQQPVLFTMQTLFVMLAATLIFQRFRFTSFEKFKWGLFAGLAVTFFVTFIMRQTEIISTDINVYRIGVIYSAVLVFIYYFVTSYKRLDFDRVKLATVPLYFSIFVLAISLEMTNVLNQHGIFIVERENWAKTVLACWVLIGVPLYFWKSAAKRNWETVGYVGFIISLAAITHLPPLQVTATTELFEQANSGMATYQLFHYGTIPYIELFDGGTKFITTLGGIFYGLLNGVGETGVDASYFYYGFNNILVGLTLFFLFKKFFSKEFALLLVLFAPLVSGAGIHLIAVSALIYALKKDSLSGYIWYFVALAIALIFDIANAIAVGVGTIVILFIIFAFDTIKERKLTNSIINFAKATAIFGGSSFGVYLVLCLFRGINPISRIRELADIVNSINTWNYGSLGDSSKFVFYIGYFILPACATLSIIFIFVKLKRDIKEHYAAIAIVSLLGAHFMSYTRMFGRHSFAEGSMWLATMFIVLPFALLACVFVPKYKKQLFLWVALVLPATVTFAVNSTVGFGGSIMDTAMRVVHDNGRYYQGSEERVTRVNYTNLFNDRASVIAMLNAIIPENETFMDLSSHSMLYAITGREKPVYVNQSPLHLSGEYSQMAFVNQIERFGDRVNFALISLGAWSSLDGIKAEYRYYKVFEYLNEGFVPLARSSDNFELWVRSERYDEAYETLIANSSMIERVAELSQLTDGNWTNGILNGNGTHLLFKANPMYQFANTITASDGSVYNYEHISTAGEYTRLVFESPEIVTAISTDEGVVYLAPEYFYPVGYDLNAERHSVNLGYIPYLWGTLDKKKAYNNEVLQDLTYSEVIPTYLQNTSNYIALRLISDEDGRAVTLSLANESGAAVVNYNFTAKEGEQTYLIRVSSNLLWGTGNITQYSVINPDDNVQVYGAWLLAGD